MTDPPEHLDSARERLADPTELTDQPPPAEFSPRALAIIWVAAIVGLVVSVCVFVMVIVWFMALP